jgi:hypothetical protein
MSSRYYFNLTDGDQFIWDEAGLELADINIAVLYAVTAIKELRAESSAPLDEWLGWRMEIISGTGEVVSVIPLDAFLLEEHPLQ